MSVIMMLYQLLIGPLQLFFEILFTLVYRVVFHPGLAIIFLSLGINLLVLPLYRRADALQDQERELERKLQPWVSRIKRAFRGDERFMILQTYYRQNHYKPVYALKGSLPLLLEIPFFIAAYRFLSNLTLLQGIPFGPIRDLGAPDALFEVNGFRVNVLPVLMTAINLVSGYIYTKGMSLKNKVQLYGMALIFLFFLYNSPAGLVFYWTLNNVFSLVKNVLYKVKNPGYILSCLASSTGIVLMGYILLHPMKTAWSQVFILVLLLLLQFPLISRLKGKRKDKESGSRVRIVSKYQTISFRLACLFLSLLLGLLIPSAVIAASPEEFVNIHAYQPPLLYVWNTFLLGAGFFLVWFQVFYYLSGDAGKKVMSAGCWIFAGCAVVNYMFFGTKFGTLSASLQYDMVPIVDNRMLTRNTVVMIVVGVLLFMIWLWYAKGASSALVIAVGAVFCMSAVNVCQIQRQVNSLKERVMTEAAEEDAPVIHLSKTGKNVIVLMMDRAINGYVLFLFEEKPELYKQFSGFTYYSNTISYGGFTNFGTPPIYGGYEYTPVEMNRRSSELLADKHNEALKVMPILFDQSGFDVTISDPPYAGYTWVPDLSVFDDYPQFNCFITDGRYVNESPTTLKLQRKRLNRNFFCYSLMKTIPLFCQLSLYDGGSYLSTDIPLVQNILDTFSESGGTERNEGRSRAVGFNNEFLAGYTVLENLSNLTEIREDVKDTFLMISNNTTHEPALLKEPEYVPAEVIDNTAYDAAHPDRKTADGRVLPLSNQVQMIHYQTNMASMMMLGKWFDYLRDNDVFDNTRIIIVSDHGRGLHQFNEMVLSDRPVEIMCYQAFLMVKDFESSGEVKVEDSFMTNADVPSLAMEGLIKNPVNPFTGNPITSNAKDGDQYILTSLEYDIGTNNGTTFHDDHWLSVHDNVFDPGNWKYCGYGVLPQVE